MASAPTHLAEPPQAAASRPRLADRLRRSLRPPRRLKFTRQGKWFVGMTLLVGFSATNTGNNLLYLLLGMMLGLIVVSGIMSEAMLRRLSAERLSAAPAAAGRPTSLEYRITNGKRRLASFSIEVREIEETDTRVRRKLGAAASPGTAVAESTGVPRCYLQRVPPASSQVRSGRVLLPRRGLYRYRGLALATRFPFGFFEKWREIDRPAELLALPRAVEPPDVVLPGERPDGSVSQPVVGLGEEYHGLRDYRTGEDARRIHWKVSARRQQPVVRLFERERTRTVALGLLLPPGGDPAGPEDEVAERAIEVAAALARQWLRAGWAVSLATEVGHLPEGTGPGQLERMLRALALIEPLDASAPATPPRPPRRGSTGVLVVAGGASARAVPTGWQVVLRVDAAGRTERAG